MVGQVGVAPTRCLSSGRKTTAPSVSATVTITSLTYKMVRPLRIKLSPTVLQTVVQITYTRDT